ncbi:hypothetical protein ABPG74_017824 [Tetrahymena malaccensis]
MNFNKWIQKYSQYLLRSGTFDLDKQFYHEVDLCGFLNKNKQSALDPFSDYSSDLLQYQEEQKAAINALRQQILSKIYRKSEMQLKNLARHSNFQNSVTESGLVDSKDNKYQHEESFITKYLKSVDGREYLIIGTYHSLQECSVEVMNLFKKFDPDSVVLELCQNRFYSLNDANGNSKTQPHRVYNDLEKDPENLSFLLKSSEFQVAYEAAQRSKKGCQIIPADLDLYYIQNRTKYLRAQCTCNVRQFRDKNSPMKQVLSYFFFGLIPYIVKRMFGYKIEVNDQVQKMEKFLSSESRHCITNVVYYEREYNILNYTCNQSQGQKVFTIVGYSHLNQIYDMLLKREEILKDYIQNTYDQYELFQFKENNFQEKNYEQLFERNKSVDDLYQKIDYSFRQYERQSYCAKLE